MKELTEKILCGDTVDIARKSNNYCLSVMKDGAEYKVGFISPARFNTARGSHPGYAYLNRDDMRNVANLLIKLADELDKRTVFANGETVYFIWPDGEVGHLPFSKSPYFLAMIAMGNLFKSHESAVANKEEVLAKFKKIEDGHLV